MHSYPLGIESAKRPCPRKHHLAHPGILVCLPSGILGSGGSMDLIADRMLVPAVYRMNSIRRT